MEGEHAERKIHSEGGKLEAIKHHFVSESMIQFSLDLTTEKKRETTHGRKFEGDFY